MRAQKQQQPTQWAMAHKACVIGICILIFNHFIHCMEKKILIVGAGKVGQARLKEVIEKTGYSESDCLIVEDLEDLKGIVSFGTPEVRQRLEIEKLPDPISFCDSAKSIRNYEKQNSQQGWKNRPKHKR